MNEVNNLISALMLLLLVSVLANLFFINARLMARRRRNREKDRFPLMLRRFLKEQSRLTLNYKQNASVPDLDPFVSKCRGAYMMIESKAVSYGIGSTEYWNFVSSKLKELFDILHKYDFSVALKSIEKKVASVKKLVKESPDITDKETIFSCLDSFLEACRKNPDKSNLVGYERKLNGLLKKLSDRSISAIEDLVDAHSSFSEAAESALNRRVARSRTASKKRLADAFEDNENLNGMVEKYYQDDESINQSMRRIVNESKAADGSLVEIMIRDQSTTPGDSQDLSSAQHLLELSESLQERSEKEIHHLKKVVRDQREAIYFLENELTKQRKKNRKLPLEDDEADRDDAAAAERELQLLKNNLRESEHCIETLESELDELRRKIADSLASRSQDASETEKGRPVDTQLLVQTAQQLEKSVNQSGEELAVLRSFRTFVEEAVCLESIEDLAMQTYVALLDLGYESQFIVIGLEREFVVSANGTISSREQSILKSLSVNETNQDAAKTKLYCHFKHLYCVASSSNADKITDEGVIQILPFLKTASDVIHRIHQAGRQRVMLRSLDREYNSIKANTSEIEKQLNTAFSNLAQSIRESLRLIQDSARANGASASQISNMCAIEQEILDEVTSQKNVTLKVKKVLLGLLNSLDKLFSVDRS